MAIDRLGAYLCIRRLPSHSRSPFHSCLHLVLLSYELSIWYDDSLVEMTGTKHTGLTPDKITPMLGVHAHRVGGCAKFTLQSHSRQPGDCGLFTSSNT